ncbi:MAG: transcription termination factor NusA [Planctomycetia bacterium]|nr:transcription termination factor NusA [Planctomycetia bacterium]
MKGDERKAAGANSADLLRLVDTIHHEKNIDREVIFQGIEAALISAAKKRFGDEQLISVNIDRKTGVIEASHNGVALTPAEIAERIGAQTAKQVMIQKIREAECDRIYRDYYDQIGQIMVGTVHRSEFGGKKGAEGGARGQGMVIVKLPNVDAILPASEQIRGQTWRPGDRVRATIAEVRKQGTRVKVTLSRTRPVFITRLFEREIPEVADGVIEIRNVARKPGVRSKVAVDCRDPRVDAVGACVGVQGNRIKNIVNELGGERIDIVVWSDDVEQMIKSALSPAVVEEIILCNMLGRAIVLVNEENLSLAIGRGGQNVHLASKLCGLDIEIMTPDELQSQLDRTVEAFCTIPGVTPELADLLVGEGFTTYDDLSIIEPEDLMRMGGLTEEEVDAIVEEADRRSMEEERQRKRSAQEGNE